MKRTSEGLLGVIGVTAAQPRNRDAHTPQETSGWGAFCSGLPVASLAGSSVPAARGRRTAVDVLRAGRRCGREHSEHLAHLSPPSTCSRSWQTLAGRAATLPSLPRSDPLRRALVRSFQVFDSDHLGWLLKEGLSIYSVRSLIISSSKFRFWHFIDCFRHQQSECSQKARRGWRAWLGYFGAGAQPSRIQARAPAPRCTHPANTHGTLSTLAVALVRRSAAPSRT